MNVLHLDWVLVDLHLPDGGELIQRETDSEELHDGAEFVAVLGVVEVSWRGGEGGVTNKWSKFLGNEEGGEGGGECDKQIE